MLANRVWSRARVASLCSACRSSKAHGARAILSPQRGETGTSRALGADHGIDRSSETGWMPALGSPPITIAAPYPVIVGGRASG